MGAVTVVLASIRQPSLRLSALVCLVAGKLIRMALCGTMTVDDLTTARPGLGHSTLVSHDYGCL